MKSFFNTVWDVLVAMGEARYAAELARAGKWKESQAVYTK